LIPGIVTDVSAILVANITFKNNKEISLIQLKRSNNLVRYKSHEFPLNLCKVTYIGGAQVQNYKVRGYHSVISMYYL